MLYALSDLHGQWEKYRAMLEKIHFSDADTLFVLGDVMDRGPEPMKILLDMMQRDNVYFILGNHDAMALQLLRRLNVEITKENAATHLDGDWMRALLEWQQDGGGETLAAFRALSPEQRGDILDYLADAPLYEAAEAGGKRFLMVHGGLGNFHPDKKMRQYTLEELCCTRLNPEREYFPDADLYILCGHTPTLHYTGKSEIYFRGRNILIDCGAAWGGRLGCLCLDTLEQYYID